MLSSAYRFISILSESDMRTTGDAFLRKVSSLIIIVTSLSIIGMMIYGGCSSGAGSPTPTRTPGSTGFPPSCDGTFDVSLSCPAVSLEGSVCLTYVYDVIDNSGPEPVVVDEFVTLRFGETCTALDCFTLDCNNISSGIGDAIFTVETVNDITVGEDVAGEINSGLPEGPIFIGDNEYYFDCLGTIVP